MKVTCTDFYGNDHVVDAAQLVDRLSVYGVYLASGSVLLMQDLRSLRWELPGGGVENRETAERALIREFEEETGITPTGRLTFLKEWEEHFFDVVGRQAWRSRRIFYRVEKILHQEKILMSGNGEDSGAARLVPLNELDMLHIAPNIRNLIKQVDT